MLPVVRLEAIHKNLEGAEERDVHETRIVAQCRQNSPCRFEWRKHLVDLTLEPSLAVEGLVSWFERHIPP